MKIVSFFKVFLENVDLFFNKKENKFYLSTGLSSVSFFLPSFFYFKKNNGNLYLLFTNKFFYLSFYRHFLYFLKRVIWIFFFKLRLKGLGYRMFQIGQYLFEFFFAKNCRYFFHTPRNIFIKRKNREILVLSNDKQILNEIFHHLLLLRKMDFYTKTKTFSVKNKILFLKKLK